MYPGFHAQASLPGEVAIPIEARLKRLVFTVDRRYDPAGAVVGGGVLGG